MVEEWRKIPGEPDWYEVSNLGRIRSYRTRQGHVAPESRLLKLSHSHGYLVTNLGKGRQFRVHNLVLRAFFGECPPGLETRHLNGNKEDNRIENLVYGTKKENGSDRVMHGTSLTGERNTRSKLSGEVIDQIRHSVASASDLAVQHNVTQSTIYRIRSGLTWKHLPNSPTPTPGRRRGEANNKAKLTATKVVQIRISSETPEVLATRYNVTPASIYNVLRRKTWSHV